MPLNTLVNRSPCFQSSHCSSSSSQPPPIAPRTSRHEFRPAFQEKQLPDAKKLSLLASLSTLDEPDPSTQTRSVYGESTAKTHISGQPHNGYSPSFGPAAKQRQFNGLAENPSSGFRAPPAANSNMDYDRSLNSSVTSLGSRKSNLMKELFGNSSAKTVGGSGMGNDDG